MRFLLEEYRIIMGREKMKIHEYFYDAEEITDLNVEEHICRKIASLIETYGSPIPVVDENEDTVYNYRISAGLLEKIKRGRIITEEEDE